MKPLIKPAYLLMNQLSYRSKFMLIASVFAIPLAVFAWQLAYTHHQQAEQAQHTQSGLVSLRDASALIKELELIRDAAVVVSWKSDSFLSKNLVKANKRAYRHIVRLLNSAPNDDSRQYLLSLKEKIENGDIIKGNESERIDGVYDSANILVQKAYSWRAKLAYSFVSSSNSSEHILSLISILNEMEQINYALGQVRTFGTLYLGQRFVESHGVDALEKSYRVLTRKIEELEVKNKEYENILQAHPEIRFDSLSLALVTAREQLYTHLIEAMNPIGDTERFFGDLNVLYEKVYTHSKNLLDLIENVTVQDYESTVNRLVMFYVSVLLMGLLILYLTAGLYQSVSASIVGLSSSATRVAEGQYDLKISIDANDELAAVAYAMDQMRLSIKEREEKLELMSQTDGLTNLYNRPFFDKAIEVSLANSRRNGTAMSIMMMDIDHFKAVNDTYGHQAGDDCLRHAAFLLKSQFQRQTDIVARYGGEEFIVILYGQDLHSAVEQTEKLRKTIEASVLDVAEQEIRFTASFGVAALTPPVMADSKSLIALADELLYKAKESGRNQVSAQEYRPLKDDINRAS